MRWWRPILAGVLGLLVLVISYQSKRGHFPTSVLPSASPAPDLSSAGAPAPSVVALRSTQATTGSIASKSAAQSVVTAAAEAPLVEFDQWVERYLATPAAHRKAVPLGEGIRLAAARRPALAQLIRTDPRQALTWAAPWRWRQELPAAVTALLEEQPSGRGNLEVYCALPMPGADYRQTEGGTVRYVRLGGKTYRAYVYGRRARQMSRRDMALHGVAVDTIMAVSEEPLRVLEPGEAEASSRNLPPTTSCALCGARLVTPVWADYGGHYLGFCGQAHASAMGKTLQAAEEAAPKLTDPGTNPPPASVSGTFGAKNVLYLRAVFADDNTVPITADQAASDMKAVSDFYAEASYNKTALITTISPLVTLPQPKMYYAVQGPGPLAGDAETAARAVGYDAGNYDLVLIRFTNVPGFTWGGLGGGGTAWLQSSGAGIAAHEIGHCYGLAHANYWDTRRAGLPPNPNNYAFDADSLVGHESVTGSGDDVSYGDPFDVMGGGGGEAPARGNTNIISALNGHFNVVGKHLLGWLPESYIAAIRQSATNRLYVNDTVNLVAGRNYALTIRKDSQRTYWVSARWRFTDNPWLQNGVELHWDAWDQAVGYSQILDTTPDSGPGVLDAALLTGRTYSDHEANIHITPVAKGGAGATTWYDVVVNVGPFPSNVPPVVNFSASTNRVPVGGTVTFMANATDANGDRLAYYWDFGDGTFGASASTITKAWTNAGEYVVRCEVSDMRGGVTSEHTVVTVGARTGLRLSGSVTDTFGNPLAGVRVSNGSLTNNDLAADYQWTYTDSAGTFTLVNLSSNTSYAIGAYLNGYVTTPLNFTLPVQLADRDGVDARFLAQPLPAVTVTAAVDATTSPPKPGYFQLTRTGDTNTSLRVVFLFGGTATTNDFQSTTNTIAQTNVNPNPFGPITNVVVFRYLDFATGAFTTNISITPGTNANPGPDLSVSLSVMYALQAQRVTDVTNTNWVSFTGWVTNAVRDQPVWFQTDPDYVPAAPADATLYLRGSPPAQPTVSIVASDAVASENQGDAGQFTLTRYGRLDLPVTVPLQIGGTAAGGSDYDALPGSVTFAAGQTFMNLPVFVRADHFLEGNKTVTVTVPANSTYKVGNASATVTIGDNDLPLITIQTLNSTANAGLGSTATLVVTRSGDINEDLVVNYLETGTAVSGQDYRILPNTVTIPAGQTSASITVTPRGDPQQLADRTLVVFLSDSPTYNIGLPNSATVVLQPANLPTVTITTTNATATEPGSSGEFTVRRIGDSSRPLVVYFLAGGSAKPLADYSGIGNSVTIPAGSGQATITINPVDDQIQEDPNDTVTLRLLPDAAYNVGSPDQATVTINDQDTGLPGIGFALLSSSVTASAGSAQVAVVVTGNPSDQNPVTVDYRVSGGSAIADLDYPFNSSTGRLVFVHNPNGGKDAYTNRMQLISIPIIDHTNIEPNLTIVLTLVPPAPNLSNDYVTNIVQDTNNPNNMITNIVTNLVVTPIPMNAYFDAYQSHTVTILDDNAGTVSVVATRPFADKSITKAGLFTLKRTTTNGNQTVYFQLTGAAVNGDDYQTVSSPIVIPAGQSSIAIPIIPISTSDQEYLEDVTLTLLNVPGGKVGLPSSATVKIINHQGTIEFTATAYAVAESMGLAQIPVQRTGDTTSVATVDFFVTAGTAVPNVNFVPTNGTLTFFPGDDLKYVPVTVLNDHVVAPPTTVNLYLTNANNGAPLGGQETATLTVLNDNTAVQFDQPTYRVNENATNALITVSRLGVVTNDFTVSFLTTNLALTNGVAQAGVDYLATNGTVHFVSGQTQAVFQVRVIDNTLLDGDRQALLLLTNASSPVVLGPQTNADLRIVDDDCRLQFAAPAFAVPSYAGFAPLTVQRVGGAVNSVSVDFTTLSGTAKPNRDYFSTSGTVTFAGDAYVLAPDGSGLLQFVAGETNKTIQIPILDNQLGLGDLQFSVRLSNARGPANALPGSAALGAQSNAVVVILDDEKPGYVDSAFNPGQGTDGTVLTLAVQTDGRVLLGGDFTKVDNVVLNHLARMHTDGYLDSFLNPGGGTDGHVLAVTVQPDGRVLIGGEFGQVNGVALNNLARVNADGTVDDSFVPGAGANAAVRALAAQTNGAIWIGGDFSGVNGTNRNLIARLNRDGSLDATFNAHQWASSGSVLAVAPLTNGQVLVAGTFVSLGGTNNTYLARMNANGYLDPTFPAYGGANGPVRALAVQADGRLLIGGDFTRFANTNRNGIARLNPDGSLDLTFDPGAGASGPVYGVGFQANGKVFVGGAFTNFNGAPAGRLVRLNPDGSTDDTFNFGSGANDTIRTLVVQPDSAVVIGGDFTVVRDLARDHIARVHGDDKYIFNEVQFSAANFRLLETGGQANITVTRNGDTNSAFSVGYLTADGTAKAGVNYQPAQGTLQFSPGTTQQTFTVTVLNDGIATGDLDVKLLLTNVPSGFNLFAQLTATLTIVDAEGSVAFASPTYKANETDGQAVIAVQRSGLSTNAVSVDYSTQDGTATNGADYTSVSGTLTLAAGETNQSFTVPILNNHVVKPDLTVLLRLANVRGGASLGQLRNAVLTIHDDDQGPFYRVTIAAAGGTVTPAPGRFPAGSVQVFTAVPNRNYEFVRWEGSTNSTQSQLALLMNQDYSLTAVFYATNYTYNFEPPFSATNLLAPPWSSAGNAPWQLESVTASAPGQFALRSGVVQDSQSSTLGLTVNTLAGAGSFDVRVSSEESWDFLEFFLNGTLVQRWSGEIPWQPFQFNLPAGTNVLTWTYAKDPTFSTGLDAGFIDNIYLPLYVAPLVLQANRSPTNIIQLQLQGPTGSRFILQASSDLLQWQPIATNSLRTNVILLTDPDAPNHPQRFYRAIVP